ncbi:MULTISPECIES: SPFH domain-containing protein [Methylobacterium]|uniref:SPFH domain-containing protein n=1 Tax=Methylobacterium longum TaxID=767694 RepID=A0ABT8AIP6_9HYPH|nr:MULTISPECIES: SPFH domain-containing protein [Methylobacterium]MCJ2100071.1 SPFH/Band 7/PHB domain protein [Methylobacterium sp. E-046]MDN3569411.1 SPFH domain-containing protein [Methylobacterium longum]GJE12292.1 Protein QmcA [Methylobacterium longum]
MGLPVGLSVFAVGVAALAIITLAAGVKIVPQGYVYTVERFGRYARSLEAGLGLITPFIERVGRRVNVMEQVIDVPSQQAFTRDNAGVTIDAVVFYQVLDAARASYEVSNLDLAATTLTMTNIRTVVGAMDLDQLLAHRDEINERLLRVMDAAASPWGVKINRIEIKDIVLPADLAGAMARQMKAEREKRASILEAEGQRAAEILRAEGRKQSAILEAEGRREAAFRDAEARERSAEAEAAATGMVSRAIAEGDIAAANFLVAEKYVDAVRAIATAPNQRVVVVPIEAAALAGTLGGIGELTRSVFGDGAAAPRRTGTPPNVAPPRA